MESLRFINKMYKFRILFVTIKPRSNLRNSGGYQIFASKDRDQVETFGRKAMEEFFSSNSAIISRAIICRAIVIALRHIDAPFKGHNSLNIIYFITHVNSWFHFEFCGFSPNTE